VLVTITLDAQGRNLRNHRNGPYRIRRTRMGRSRLAHARSALRTSKGMLRTVKRQTTAVTEREAPATLERAHRRVVLSLEHKPLSGYMQVQSVAGSKSKREPDVSGDDKPTLLTKNDCGIHRPNMAHSVDRCHKMPHVLPRRAANA
jgi:hypothetical protein